MTRARARRPPQFARSQEVIVKLNAAVQAALADATVRNRFANQGMDIPSLSSSRRRHLPRNKRPNVIRRAIFWKPIDSRAHGGTIHGSILFTGTASPSPRGRRSTAAAAPQQFWPDQLWSSAPSTAHHGNDNGACPARPSRHTVCLGGCAPHISAAPFGATACNCPSSRARAARGNQRPSCSNGRNRYAEASRPDRQ
jgi:hypothetical protein